MQVLKKYDDWERRTGYFCRKKKVKTKIIYLEDAGNDKLLHWLLLSLACWLMLARRLCVYNAGLKVDVDWEILTVVMMSYYENVCLFKRHKGVRCGLCFWQFTLLFLGLVTHYHESWYTVYSNEANKPLVISFMYVLCSIRVVACPFRF